MAIIIKSSIIAVFLVLGLISSTSICCVGAIGTEDTNPGPKPKSGMPWCYPAGIEQGRYPCSADGCRRLCEHFHYKSDKAYCKIGTDAPSCCCPNE